MRLIDAESLKYQIESSPLVKGEKREVLFEIDHAPTVEERKVGYWIMNHPSDLMPYKCSCCRNDSAVYGNYCYECGALMDGNGESDESI